MNGICALVKEAQGSVSFFHHGGHSEKMLSMNKPSLDMESCQAFILDIFQPLEL